jgi:hypothetical protein
VAPEVIRAIVEPLEIDSKRLRLTLDGGMPWETFQVERAKFRLAYKSGSAAYWMFKAGVLALTLVLPPKRFYQLHSWYGQSSWRRWRRALGEPSPRAEISSGPTAVGPANLHTKRESLVRSGTEEKRV